MDSSVTKRRTQSCFFGENILNQNCKKRQSFVKSEYFSFWYVMELLRIMNFGIGEGKILFEQNNFLSSPLSVKSS